MIPIREGHASPQQKSLLPQGPFCNVMPHANILQVEKDVVAMCRCGQILGSVDGYEYRLRKSRLKNSLVHGELLYLVADMLAVVEAHAVHTFLIKGGGSGERRLVWILTTDARVTASRVSLRSPGQRVIKVMYKSASEIDEENQEIEIICVDVDVMHELCETLDRHHKTLSMEGMQEWQSSFLSRYELPI